MRRIALCLMTVALTAALGRPGLAGDEPLAPSYGYHAEGFDWHEGGARLILPPENHPEVAVSRSLAAQPVHPYLMEVQIGDDRDLTSGILTTYIDPLQRLDGNEGIDDNHSLVKLQRLYRGLKGVTTSDLAAASQATLRARPRGASSNRAQVVLPIGVSRMTPMNLHDVDGSSARSVIMVPRRMDWDSTKTPSEGGAPKQAVPQPNTDPQETEGKDPRIVHAK